MFFVLEIPGINSSIVIMYVCLRKGQTHNNKKAAGSTSKIFHFFSGSLSILGRRSPVFLSGTKGGLAHLLLRPNVPHWPRAPHKRPPPRPHAIFWGWLEKSLWLHWTMSTSSLIIIRRTHVFPEIMIGYQHLALGFAIRTNHRQRIFRRIHTVEVHHVSSEVPRSKLHYLTRKADVTRRNQIIVSRWIIPSMAQAYKNDILRNKIGIPTILG